MRRLLRILGTLMIAAGVLCLVWAVLVWQWQDPFTAVYTHLEQRQLASSYERRLAEFDQRVAADDTRPVAAAPSNRELGARVRTDARSYRKALGRGDAVGAPPRAATRTQHGRRQRHRQRHADEGPRTLPRLVHARRGQARLHRRPPDDVLGAVLADREPAARRSRRARAPVRHVRVPRHADM